MGFKNTSALVSIVAAALLGFFYIQPTFSSIGEIQDEIFVFKDNADKVTEVNSLLNQLLNEINSLRQSDIVALETYLPTSTDTLQVMYDVETLAVAAGLTVNELSSVEADANDGTIASEDIADLDITPEEQQAIELADTVTPTDVEVALEGSYDNFKNFLATIANNHYPLEVVALEFGDTAETEDGTLGNQAYVLTLRTYSFNYLSNR